MPLKTHVARLGATVAIAFTMFGTASAEADFCSETATCTTVYVYNRSSALVTSTKIEQHTTDGACEYADNTFSQNLVGWGGGEDTDGEYFEVSLNVKCKYKFKFHTTSGCAGDKTTHLTPDNFADGKDVVQLNGACGSLKTIKY